MWLLFFVIFLFELKGAFVAVNGAYQSDQLVQMVLFRFQIMLSQQLPDFQAMFWLFRNNLIIPHYFNQVLAY